MELKFCCSHFQAGYYLENKYNLAIQIIRFTSEYLIKGNANDKGSKRKKDDTRFFITTGYETFGLERVIGTSISYCPYCGKNLYKFYQSDEYANEIEGETFPSES